MKVSTKGLKVAGVAVALMAALMLEGRTRALEEEASSPFPIQPSLRWSDSLGPRPMPGDPVLDLQSARYPIVHSLRWGDTISSAFANLGVPETEVHSATRALEVHLDLRDIRAGEQVLAFAESDGEVSGLKLRKPGTGWVELERVDQAWEGQLFSYGEKVKVEQANGELDSFLEADLVEAGGPRELAVAMSDILQWDLDFNRDLRTGDRFQLLYESIELRGDGWKERNLGTILALVYDSAGQRYEAYRYGEKGYYDERGRPLKKMFLRSPLPFSRVTSSFNLRRFHPILKKTRPHYGVDYGAPVGTPVRATAVGTVLFAGTSGGAGKMVKLSHRNGYETAYLHLSKFAKGIRKGTRVQQGEVVGYVGSTGLSTGAHLDYRVRHDNQWINPASLDSEPAEPLADDDLVNFSLELDDLRKRLAS